MKDAVLGLVRHSLTSAGGALVASGVLSASDVNTLVGAAVIVAGAVWSLIEKRLRAKQWTG